MDGRDAPEGGPAPGGPVAFVWFVMAYCVASFILAAVMLSRLPKDKGAGR